MKEEVKNLDYVKQIKKKKEREKEIFFLTARICLCRYNIRQLKKNWICIFPNSTYYTGFGT